MLWLPPYPSPTFFHKLFKLFQQLKRKRGQVLEMLQHVSSVIKQSRTLETWVQNWLCLGCFCRQNDAELKISAIAIFATLPNVVCYEIGWNTVPKQVDPSNAPLQVINTFRARNSAMGQKSVTMKIITAKWTMWCNYKSMPKSKLVI